jgi:thiol-disulfide isomerase/thioredoxin
MSLLAQSTVIRGTIKDTSYSHVIVEPMYGARLVDEKQESRVREGHFEIKISTINHPKYYALNYKNNNCLLFVVPGQVIDLEVDMADWEHSLKFKGKNANDQRFMNLKSTPRFLTKEKSKQYGDFAKNNSFEKFDDFLKEALKKVKDSIKAMPEFKICSPVFKSFVEKNDLELAYIGFKFNYPYYAKMRQDSFFAKNQAFVNTYTDEWLESNYKGMPKLYQTIFTIKQLENDMAMYLNGSSEDENELAYYQKLFKHVQSIQNKALSMTLQEYVIGQWILYYGNPTKMNAEIVGFIDALGKNPKANGIKKKLLFWSQYDAGKQAPIFEFADVNGKIHQSTEFIGKVVYLDVWASWCGPCMREMPFSDELKKEYKDNDQIVFLYISIDEKKDAWMEAAKRLGLNENYSGIAYPGGFRSEFAKKYSVNSIPHYVLIDKKGNLVSHKAERPSRKEEVMKWINNALNK